MKLISNNLNRIAIVIALFITMSSCETFLDVNEDPNASTNPPGETLFPRAQVSLESQRNIELGSTVSMMTQTMTSNGSAGVFLNPERWIVSTFLNGNSYTAFNTTINNNLQLFINQASEQSPVPNNSIAQAELIQSYTFWALTVIWGDVVFVNANNPEFPTPEFDSQETVLRGLITKIDNALSLINEDSEVPAIEEGDLWYNGDMEQWRRFGNSLKLRILMFIYTNQDRSVAPQIRSLIDNEFLIRDNFDNTLFPYGETEGNENQMFQLHEDFANGEPLFFFASKVMTDIMNASDDPRRSTYFFRTAAADDTTADGAAAVPAGEFEGPFIGQDAGAVGFNAGIDFSLVGDNILRPTFPGRILTASEVLFHEAEFEMIEGNAGAARSKLADAIRASIDFFDEKPGAIEDVDRDAFVDVILTNFDAADAAGKLEIIREQHFVDVFEKTPENWALWKRTKVPALQTPEQANLSAPIRRFDYPQSERSANPNTPNTQPLITPLWFEGQ